MTTASRGERLLKTRRRILTLIRETPGLHLRELTRKLEIPLSTADYHLKLLEKDGLISSVGLSGRKRFFERESVIYYEGIDLNEKDKKTLSFLRQRIPFLVIRYLLIKGKARMNSLTSSLGLSGSTLHHYIARMVEEGVLIRTSSGAEKGCRLADQDRTKDLYLFYRRSYEDEVDEFTDIWLRL